MPIIKPETDIRSPSSRRAWIEINHRVGLAGELRVALLAEGVDRNKPHRRHHTGSTSSPSSRRAWIEIPWPPERRRGSRVALLAEGVDRNRKWVTGEVLPSVALLAEGVDRNKTDAL